MYTPLIRTIQISGGTFYAFSSADRDFTRAGNNDNIKAEFSNFALLNIPNIDTPLQKQNYIQFRTIDGTIFDEPSPDNNINLIQSFQNYALNIESLILSDNDYDHTIKRSVAERVFFKWLKELGAIRFREADDTEKIPSLVDKRFVEEDSAESGTRRYNRVIEYIGNIDVTNIVEKAGQTYTEVYINVPTKVGNTPVILLDTIEDLNYSPDMIISGENEFINGRNTSTIHPDGLSVNAYYDYDAAVNYTDDNADWHGSLQTDSYFTEPDSFENPDSIEITKTSDDYIGTPSFSDVNYLRSKLDGISLDFNSENYTDIGTDNSMSTIQEYNSSLKASNFKFNCILVYYDYYDTSAPEDSVKNLYGIIFLDNITSTISGGYIQRLTKIKPNSVTGLNGNSWSLTFNTKVSSNNNNNASIETIINEYSTFSMDLFIDASVKLQEASKTLLDTQSQFLNIVNRVNSLENLIFTSTDSNEFNTRLSNLENALENAGLALSDSSSILDLISSNSDNIQDIINGQIPINLQYNTDVIKEDSGIIIDKTVPNKVKIKNKNQKYNLNVIYNDIEYNNIININNPINLNSNNINIYTKLRTFTNMIRVNSINDTLSNIRIYIDDTVNSFQNGQVLRLVWENEIDLNSNNIIFYSDKNNSFGQGTFNKLLGNIAPSNLISNQPIIELVCLDKDNYNFAIDILR